ENLERWRHWRAMTNLLYREITTPHLVKITAAQFLSSLMDIQERLVARLMLLFFYRIALCRMVTAEIQPHTATHSHTHAAHMPHIGTEQQDVHHTLRRIRNLQKKIC